MGYDAATKKDIINYTHDRLKSKDRIFKYMVTDIFNAFWQAIAYNIEHGERTFIRGLGTFYPISELVREEDHFYYVTRNKFDKCTIIQRSRCFKPSKILEEKVRMANFNVFKSYNSNIT